MPFKAIVYINVKKKATHQIWFVVYSTSCLQDCGEKEDGLMPGQGPGSGYIVSGECHGDFFVRAEWPLLKRGGAYCRKCGLSWQAHHCSRMQIWDVNSILAFMFKFNSAVLYPYNYNTDLICYSPNIHKFLNLKQRKFQKQGETCYVNLVLIK